MPKIIAITVAIAKITSAADDIYFADLFYNYLFD